MPASPQPDDRLPRGWRPSADSATERRRSATVLALGAAAVAVVGGLIALLGMPTTPTRPGVIAVAPDPATADKLDRPYDPVGWRSADHLLKSADAAGLRPLADAPIPLDQVDKWTGAIVSATADPVLVYVALPGEVDAAGDPLLDGATKLDHVIDALAGVDRRVVLVLDHGRDAPDLFRGHYGADYAASVATKLGDKIRANPKLLVVCGTSGGLAGWEDSAAGQTAVSRQLLAAFTDPLARGADPVFTAADLFARFRDKLTEWSRANRPTDQIPVAIPDPNDWDAARNKTFRDRPFGPPGTATDATPGPDSPPTELRAKWEQAEKLAPSPLPVWLRHREFLLRYERGMMAGDEVGCGLLAAALNRTAARLDRAKQPPAEPKPEALDRVLAEATAEGSTRTLPDAAKAVRAALTAGSLRTVEVQYLLMLDDFYANVAKDAPPDLWRTAVRTRVLAERAANGPTITPAVLAADADRRTAEDRLLAAPTDETAALFAKAAAAYRAATIPVVASPRGFADLPFLTRWLAEAEAGDQEFLPQAESDKVADLWKQVHGAGNAAKGVSALTDLYRRQATRLATTPAARNRWNGIRHLLLVPPPLLPAADRAALLTEAERLARMPQDRAEDDPDRPTAEAKRARREKLATAALAGYHDRVVPSATDPPEVEPAPGKSPEWFVAQAGRLARDHYFDEAGKPFSQDAARAVLASARGVDAKEVERLLAAGKLELRPRSVSVGGLTTVDLHPAGYAVPGEVVVWFGGPRTLLPTPDRDPRLIPVPDGRGAVTAYFRGQKLSATLAPATDRPPDLVAAEIAPPAGALVALRGAVDFDPGAVTVLLDYSASMDSTTNGVSKFDQMMDAVGDLLGTLPAGTRLSVWTMDENPKITDEKAFRRFPDPVRFGNKPFGEVLRGESGLLAKLRNIPRVGNHTPLLPAMELALADLPATLPGTKTLIVVTDGADTSQYGKFFRGFKDVSEMTADERTGVTDAVREEFEKRFRRRDVSVRMILYAAADEEQLARDMFQAALERPAVNPVIGLPVRAVGRLTRPQTRKELTAELARAVRPRPKLLSATGQQLDRVVPADGLPVARTDADAADLWWYGAGDGRIRPGLYQLNYDELKQNIRLDAGDLLAVRLRRTEKTVQFAREVYYRDVDPQPDGRRAEAGPWFASVPGHKDDGDGNVSLTVAVEEKNATTAVGGVLQPLRPAAVWWDVPRAAGPVAVWSLAGQPAPSWRVVAKRPEAAGTRLNVYAMLDELPRVGPPLRVPVGKLDVGDVRTIDGGAVTVRVRRKPMAFLPAPSKVHAKLPADAAGEEKDCLVVEVSDAGGRLLRANIPGLDVRVREHRYYFDPAAEPTARPRMAGYVGVFGPLPPDGPPGETVPVEIGSVSAFLDGTDPLKFDLGLPRENGRHPPDPVPVERE